MLELGSGTGLVGLVAGYLGARVCITDQAYVYLLIPESVISVIRQMANRHPHKLWRTFCFFARGYKISKVSHPNYGAQYLAQQIAIKRDSGGTRLVRLPPSSS